MNFVAPVNDVSFTIAMDCLQPFPRTNEFFSFLFRPAIKLWKCFRSMSFFPRCSSCLVYRSFGQWLFGKRGVLLLVFLLAVTADGIVFVAFSRSVDMSNILTSCTNQFSNYAAQQKTTMELLCSSLCSLCVAIMSRMLERREFWQE